MPKPNHHLRLTPEHDALVRVRAARAGVSPTEYLRGVVARHVEEDRMPQTPNFEELPNVPGAPITISRGLNLTDATLQHRIEAVADAHAANLARLGGAPRAQRPSTTRGRPTLERETIEHTGPANHGLVPGGE